MKANLFRAFAGCAFVVWGLAGAAAAQDFQQSYRLGAGASVNVQTVSGDVRVTGYDGDAITVAGYKEGRDLQMVEIEDRSSGNRVDVRVRYPENCRRCNVSVRFEVRVPRNIDYRFDSFGSVSGSVEVTDVTGELRVNSVSGDVTVKGARGEVKANTVSGSVHIRDVVGSASGRSVSGAVEVEVTKLAGNGNMEFTSVSGGITARMPANLDADVEMSAMSGTLKSDFPIQIEKAEWGPRRSARGRVGNGSRLLKMSSVSGNVSLLRQ